MQDIKKGVWAGVLLVLAITIRLYSADAQRVETGYAIGLYPSVAALLRLLLGWIPFSMGDLAYGIFGGWVLWKLFRGIQIIYRKQASWSGLGIRFAKIGTLFLLLYVVFNAFWGINYNRRGIAYQLHLKMDRYSLEELKNMNALLAEKVNSAKQQLVYTKTPDLTTRALFEKVSDAYHSIDSSYPFLQYRNPSLKPSLWGWLGNYVGFAGYYNPFSGEAQVNTTLPKFLQPFTACHEVAHQLGYAKEMEANFVGYLAASASNDQRFQYSVYLDLFLYSNRNLYGSDTLSARHYAQQLAPEVKADLAEWREFSRRHKNPVEPIIRWMYGKYLESNQQPQGVLSYDEVTSFLIAYYKKFGKI